MNTKTDSMYEARTEDGVGFIVTAATYADAMRQARTHLRDVLTHINPAQRITVTRCDWSGIEWHRD
jgi:hypothetical protein